MSLYIRVMTSFWSHRKTAKLRCMIGDHALWLPLRLWSYAAESQPNGCFKQYSNTELAMLLGYLGDADRMVEALHQSGFMVDMSIHDWEEHNAFHQKFSDRAKKAAEARWAKSPSPQTPLPEKEMEREREQALTKQCLSNPLAVLENATSIPGKKEREQDERSDFLSRLSEMGLMDLWDSYSESRKRNKATMTVFAEVLLLRELFVFPGKIRTGLEMAIKNGWKGFEWKWVDKDLKAPTRPSQKKANMKTTPEAAPEDLMTPMLERMKKLRESNGELEEVL